MKDFRTLKVWEKSHQLTLAIYQASAGLPKSELYGLTSQLQRASVSIPANIAEGCGKRSDAEFARFLQIAMGSANEVDYYILLVRDLGLLNCQLCKQLSQQVTEVKCMLASLIRKVRADSKR